MTDSEKAYFASFEELFDSPAWRQLSDMWTKDLEDIPRRAFWTAESWDEILAARALCRKLEEYLRTPAAIELQKAHTVEMREQLESDKRELERPDV